MKQFILAVVVLMFSAPAFAIESWTATGTKVIDSSATTDTLYMDFKLEGFATSALCNKAITTAAAQVLDKGDVLRIFAGCVKARPADVVTATP